MGKTTTTTSEPSNSKLLDNNTGATAENRDGDRAINDIVCKQESNNLSYSSGVEQNKEKPESSQENNYVLHTINPLSDKSAGTSEISSSNKQAKKDELNNEEQQNG